MVSQLLSFLLSKFGHSKRSNDIRHQVCSFSVAPLLRATGHWWNPSKQIYTALHLTGPVPPPLFRWFGFSGRLSVKETMAQCVWFVIGWRLHIFKQKSNSKIHKRVLHTLKLWSRSHIRVNIQAFYIRDVNPWRNFSFYISYISWGMLNTNSLHCWGFYARPGSRWISNMDPILSIRIC